MSKTRIELCSYLPDNPSMRCAIEDLLVEAFGDYRAYYALSLKHLASPDTTFLLCENKCKVVAHIQVAPYTAHLEDGRSLCVAYLYAVATLKAYRGQGLMGQLLHKVLKLLPSQGFDGVALLPSEASLHKFYERFGFLKREGQFTMLLPDKVEALRPSGSTLAYLNAVKQLDGQLPTDNDLPYDVHWMYCPLNDQSLPIDLPLLAPLS